MSPIIINCELWKRLEQFELDSGTPRFGFADRLARENGWTKSEAERAIIEYKRFLYLAMTAGHPVTPSESVDQVWHLHLTYTQSYWNSLCKDVLGKPLHHNPTEGGNQERVKFQDWYSRTLESYRTFFGEEPLEKFWPNSDARFRNLGAARWIDTSTHWVIGRRRFWKSLMAALAALLMLGGTLGALPLIADDGAGWIGVVIVVGIIVLSSFFGSDDKGKGTKSDDGGCGCGGCGDGGCGCGGCGGCGG